jgi:protein gp37
MIGIGPKNVWMGTSVENQEYADRRLPKLLQIPAIKRFVSYEPALGSVDFKFPAFTGLLNERRLCGGYETTGNPAVVKYGDTIDWLIIGGESGPGARPCSMEWVRSAVRQCRDAGVVPFVKQLGRCPTRGSPVEDYRFILKDHKGGDPAEWPEDLRVREFPE